MDLAIAKRVASTLEWASSTDEWGSCISQIAVEGDRLERYPWFTDKANFGAFDVHVPGRQSLELVLGDQYERGDFYLAVYLKNRTAGTFADHSCPLKRTGPEARLRGLTPRLPHALRTLWRSVGSSRHEGRERREWP